MQTNGMDPIDVEINQLKEQSAQVLKKWHRAVILFRVIIVLLGIMICLNIYRAWQLGKSMEQYTEGIDAVYELSTKMVEAINRADSLSAQAGLIIEMKQEQKQE